MSTEAHSPFAIRDAARDAIAAIDVCERYPGLSTTKANVAAKCLKLYEELHGVFGPGGLLPVKDPS